jgi:formate hydrogenlyase subunit 4
MMGLLLGLSINLFYALVFQRLLLLKTSNRLIGAVSVLAMLTIFPLIAVVIVGARFTSISSIWFLTFMPMVGGQLIFGIGSVMALLGQWTLIVLISGEMTQKLKSISSSESKRLTENSAQFSLSK